MFARSLTVLAGNLPPFAIFYRSMAGTLTTTAAPRRMQVASALWRRTAPKYGIRFSAPRVAAAKQIYKNEGPRLAKSAKTKAKAKPSRRVRRLKAAAQHARKASYSPAPKKKTTKKMIVTVKRSKTKRAKAASAQKKRSAVHKKKKSAAKAVKPYAVFTAQVMKQAKLTPTPTNRNRVFRMWLMTREQHFLSMSKRVSMAVRLLNKNKKSKRRLSKKMTRKADKKAAKRGIKPRRKRHSRIAGKTATQMKARKSAVARKAVVRKPKSRKAAVRRPKAVASRKVRKITAAKSKARRTVSRKRKTMHAKRHSHNPYIDFYRRMRMTGLLPNSPKVVGSRKIKELWARTHALPSIDARVAQATKMLEAQTRSKARTATPRKATRKATRKAAAAVAPVAASTSSTAHATAPATVTAKDIKVPIYYERNPFGATYAALLPALQDIPVSTRMAHVAKAWTNTERKDDHRSAKQRIAAVAHELGK